MTELPTAYSEDFHDYARLMVRLHREMSHGDPDGPDADAIRDRMDTPWSAMSQEERELTGGLSEDLYTVGEELTSNGDSNIDGIHAVGRLMASRDFARALVEVRREQSTLPADFVAHCRGVCWAEWGQFEAAGEFFDEALRLAPNSPLHQAMRLALALQTRSFDDVVDLANRVVLSTKHVRPLCYATIILGIQGSKLVSQGEEADGRQLYKSAIRGAGISLELARTEPIEGDRVWELSTALVWGAVAQDQLGDSKRASELCDQALSIDPSSEVAANLRSQLPCNSSVTGEASGCTMPGDTQPRLPVSFADAAAAMLTPA